MSKMNRIKAIAAAVAALIMIIVIFQNLDARPTRVLFMTVTMPHAILLLITLLAGVVIGILSAAVFFSRRR